MCGRFTLALPADALTRLLKLNRDLDREIAEKEASKPRFNIAPGQELLAIVADQAGTGRNLRFFVWGVVPGWAGKTPGTRPLINARAETIAEKPAFREAFKYRRCLIPADGFYEWPKSTSKNQPWYFSTRDSGGFTMAGLWEQWRQPDGGILNNCAIVTTTANLLIGRLHTRMPVILAPEAATRWLRNEPLPNDHLRALLKPYAPEKMTAHPVDPRVNDVRIDDPDCRRPVAERGDPQAELF